MVKKSTIKSLIVLTSIFLLSGLSHLLAQEKDEIWIKPDSLYKYVQPSASMQFWSTYSFNEELKLEEAGPLSPVQNRLNFLARRARIGFKGKPYKIISYNLTIQFDNLGKDRFSSVRGGTNTGQLGILDAYLGFKLTKNDLATLTLGYLHPQISRESITGDLLVNSLDKSPSQSYIRQHIVGTGKGYGRSTGLNLGGLKTTKGFGYGYNVGIFNNLTTSDDHKKYPETAGKWSSPFITSRFTFTFGAPEAASYSLNYGMNNYFSKRRGITLGVNASHQGKTQIFERNNAFGLDFLLNYSHLNLDGEMFWLTRAVEGKDAEYRSGHIRAGYNLIVRQKYLLEPTFMAGGMEGSFFNDYRGRDLYYDFGVNWYLNKQNYRISLHYILQTGNGNNGYTDGKTFKKGNYLGLALILII